MSAGPKDGAPSLPGGDAPAWLTHLPVLIRSLWEEVRGAYAAGSFTLVGPGTRTLVDRMAQDLIGETGSFAQALRALHEHGHIDGREREWLGVAVEVGNAVAHRRMDLRESEAHTLVCILETVLPSVYLPKEDVESLRKRIPPRSSQAKGPVRS